MENWGIITFRENALLFNEKVPSITSKRSITTVVAHELAHQWFGNLVTMDWWTHLWLNEGFASFMEHLVTNHIYPEYDIMSRFLVYTHLSALELDGRHNSHPIEITVGHPSEVEAIFDNISYQKGASIIRMLHHYIGDEVRITQKEMICKIKCIYSIFLGF